MKTISLKIPDELYDKVEKYRKLENVNRTSFVLEAVAEYSKKIERDELGKQLEEESVKVRAESLRIAKEMEGLDDHLLD